MRILLSEGSSTSAREAITALGLAGHHLEICDPDPHCLGRFSRLVRKFHRCPGLGVDPQGYLDFVLDLVAGGRFDVLLPIHEQGFLFARVRERLTSHVAVALPSFESYQRAHSKTGFSRLLSELDLPQPPTHVVTKASELAALDRFPVVVKLAIGTASRGTWIVRTPAELQDAIKEIESTDGFADGVVVQEFIEGPVEHAQAVFADGHLVAIHGYRRIAPGAGGGEAIKESVRSETVRDQVSKIGENLRWHGAISFDYIVATDSGVPHYIDCNPRLVEPMSAVLAGLDLADVLVRVSRGETPSGLPQSRVGVRTQIAIQALLGCALQDNSRLRLLQECWDLMTKRGPYADSREELTPVRLDWPSALPAIVTALWLLVTPKAARYLPRRGWGSHLLTPQSARTIRNMTGAPAPIP